MPVQSRMPVPACAEEVLAELPARAAVLSAASGGNLLECFAAVPAPRDPRGIRHSLLCVLALCTATVLCGNTAIEDVTAWVHAAPQEVLAPGGGRRAHLVPGRRDRCSRTEPMACTRWRRRLRQPGLPPCSVVVCRAGYTGTRGGPYAYQGAAKGFHGRDRPPGARAWMSADTNRDGVRCLPLHSSR